MNKLIAVCGMILTVFLLSCISIPAQNNGGDLEEANKDILNGYATLDELLVDWRKDSTGCLKLRNEAMAVAILQEAHLIGKTRDEVVALLGNPNRKWERSWKRAEEKREKKYYYLSYDFDVYCKDNQPTESKLNRCWLDVIFDPDSNEAIIVQPGCS